ncbi:hypothetical protein quinque_014991 [Culex quinquefasciatus]
MAEEELMVVLRKSEDATFGFSLLRTEVFPHVIYDIVENSPAAECGENYVVDERSERSSDRAHTWGHLAGSGEVS